MADSSFFSLEESRYWGKRAFLPSKTTTQVGDVIFPGYVARMTDGRFATDYRLPCTQNVPTGQQFATKQWVQKNATDIIDISRRRLAQNTGAIYGMAEEIPFASVQHCTKTECNIYPTGIEGGIGLQRFETTPTLFGTYDFVLEKKPFVNVPMTTKYEGGRNTPQSQRT